MAEQDKIERMADAIHKMADEAEQSLARDGYQDYGDKPQDRDWRKGYVRACRDNERALRE